MRIFIFCSLLFISNLVFSQISLPKKFKCIDMSGQTNNRDNYFTDGTYSFHHEVWGREFENEKDFLDYFIDKYKSSCPIKKTRDGLYWGTGVFEGKYKYIILIPNELATSILSSNINGTQFSNYSSWLLQQVRNNLSSGKDLYFTDYNGKECIVY